MSIPIGGAPGPVSSYDITAGYQVKKAGVISYVFLANPPYFWIWTNGKCDTIRGDELVAQYQNKDGGIVNVVAVPEIPTN